MYRFEASLYSLLIVGGKHAKKDFKQIILEFTLAPIAFYVIRKHRPEMPLPLHVTSMSYLKRPDR
jgi:hypothetical protein